jgi:hypothetical protein
LSLCTTGSDSLGKAIVNTDSLIGQRRVDVALRRD